MKINIAQIPKDGLSLNLSETRDATSLDLNTPEINFISPIEISARVAKVSNMVLVNVKVTGLIESVCSRCLEEFKMDFLKEFKFDYSINSVRDTKLPQENKISNGVKENEQFLDITDDIRQELILNYPMKLLCKEDCKGLCPVCSQNLNKGDCIHAFT